ncbi:GNAT family N-acetyltransferase [Kribbella sp. NPDC051586]|uniref:GNAT family N-acetyltransferase n=1 Tax=Kribbella sp. NPDC051586 TaxID=3364118 RepID=UPI003791C068
MNIEQYDGDREVLRPFFRLADDSEQQIDADLKRGDVLVADDDGELVGQVQVVAGRERIWELTSLAVIESRRGEGIGRLLVDAAVRHCRQQEAVRLLVATAAADIGNLRFYQRQGFRMLCIERDAFGAAAGYPDGIVIDGIPLLDRVWFDQEFSA